MTFVNGATLGVCLTLSLSASAAEFEVPIPGGAAVFAITEGEVSPQHVKRLTRWISRTARSIAGYADAFPAPQQFLSIRPTTGSGIQRGCTFATDPPSIAVTVGTETSGQEFDNDWVLAHEMVHISVPDLAQAHLWFEEELAGYVEALARTWSGHRDERKMWHYLHRGIAQGEPRSHEGGLDGTRRWGRVSWGSVLFFLEADVTMRTLQPQGGGLPAVLRAWRERGLDIRKPGRLSTLLRIADEVAGAPVFTKIYARTGTARGESQPQNQWRALGLLNECGEFRVPEHSPPHSLRARLLQPAPQTLNGVAHLVAFMHCDH